MRKIETNIQGVLIIETDVAGDDRGWFARHFDLAWFAAPGPGDGFRPNQISQSSNARRGTLRGLHFQRAPHAEAKLVRCLKGAVFDVAVDLRSESPTFRQWVGVHLDDRNRHAIMIPKGFAHGFITLEDDTDLLYITDHPWTKAAEGGLMWDDPKIGIEWPLQPSSISERDRSHGYL